MKRFLPGVLCLSGLLLSGCPSPEQVRATYDLICVREAQTLFMIHGQVNADATMQAEVNRRYEACIRFYTAH